MSCQMRRPLSKCPGILNYYCNSTAAGLFRCSRKETQQSRSFLVITSLQPTYIIYDACMYLNSSRYAVQSGKNHTLNFPLTVEKITYLKCIYKFSPAEVIHHNYVYKSPDHVHVNCC